MLGRNAFISVFDKNTNLIWSTFLGDKASSAGHGVSFDPATDVQRRLFVAGAVSYEHDDYLTFEPLCDPGFGGYYQDEPLTDFYPDPFGTYNSDGFILGFDIDGFPEDPPVGLDIYNYLDLQVFPNPTNGVLFINDDIEWSYCIIYSLQGVFLRQYNYMLSGIDISTMPSGIYFIEVITNEGKSVHKVVKY